MNGFNPWIASTFYFNIWHFYVNKAKAASEPIDKATFELKAMKAQMAYVIWVAYELSERRKESRGL